MIFVTGDTHGSTDISKISAKNWRQSNKLTKNDYLIIAGDFGVLWNNQPDNHEIYWLIWLMEKPFTTLFIDGNHENFNRLNNLPLVEKFGGTVGQVRDNNIYHLRRGEIYTIDNKTIFTFGGAQSIDKHVRTDQISWWKEEIPNYKETEYALSNLEKHNNCVDYIITHTAPYKMINKLNNIVKNDFVEKMKDPTAVFLDELYSTVKFKKWFCGHFHVDIELQDKNFEFLYNQIKSI